MKPASKSTKRFSKSLSALRREPELLDLPNAEAEKDWQKRYKLQTAEVNQRLRERLLKAGFTDAELLSNERPRAIADDDPRLAAANSAMEQYHHDWQAMKRMLGVKEGEPPADKAVRPKQSTKKGGRPRDTDPIADAKLVNEWQQWRQKKRRGTLHNSRLQAVITTPGGRIRLRPLADTANASLTRPAVATDHPRRKAIEFFRRPLWHTAEPSFLVLFCEAQRKNPKNGFSVPSLPPWHVHNCL